MCETFLFHYSINKEGIFMVKLMNIHIAPDERNNMPGKDWMIATY
jgi:hypothetical protein